jgi:hypothetical protein
MPNNAFRRGRHIARPHAVQQTLHGMGEAGHVFETQSAAGAFDGMGSAEDGVQEFGIGMALQLEQPRFHFAQVLAGLLEKGLPKTVDIEFHGFS